MTVSKDIKTKPTRALYKRIYRAYISGLNHAGLREAFKVSQSTVARALDWCRKIGMDSLPDKDPLIKQTLNDINFRRATLLNKLMKNKNISDICKLNEQIIKLDNQRLSLKGIIVHREGIDFSKLSEIPDEDLEKFMACEKELKPDSEEEDENGEETES